MVTTHRRQCAVLIVAALLGACDKAVPTSPAARVVDVGSNAALVPSADWDPESSVLAVCKWTGPAGSYTFHIDVAGNGDYELPGGADATLTFSEPITFLNAGCTWVYFPVNQLSWANGVTNQVTVTEIGYMPDSIAVNRNSLADGLARTGTNKVTVMSNYDDWIQVNYFNNPLPAVVQSYNACRAVFWRRDRNADQWPATGYPRTQLLGSIFANAGLYSLGGKSLASYKMIDALNLDGGKTVQAKAGLLMRHAVAALLNDAHPGVNYGWTKAMIVQKVNEALATGRGKPIHDLAATLSVLNRPQTGCPLKDL